MATPIKLNSHKVSIKAPRELIYQKMSSFGSGRLKGDNNESSKVIRREGNEIIAEFKTKAGPFTYTTVEKVTLFPNERITFEHLTGPLDYAWEEFVFEDVDGDTVLTHNGEFIWKKIPLIGWIGGKLYTKRSFEKVIEEHLKQIKEACEARAARSHVFRQKSETPTPD